MSPITLVEVQASRGWHTYDFGEYSQACSPKGGQGGEALKGRLTGAICVEECEAEPDGLRPEGVLHGGVRGHPVRTGEEIYVISNRI